VHILWTLRPDVLLGRGGPVVGPTVIFDFDGTIARGSGPVVAYAKALAERAANPDLLVESLRAIDAFESGSLNARDGYGAVASAATSHGVTAADMNAAYLWSRELLGSELAPVDLPADLAPFLQRLGAIADVWLATNAPATGVTQLLGAAGLQHGFARMFFDVGKPDGLVPILAEALTRGPVLSVGDVYDYDLAPAARLGAATALVGAHSSRNRFEVTMRASRLVTLFPAIEDWAATAALSRDASHEDL
jgi:FMN phosphatase YigB (HAD superfamily)